MREIRLSRGLVALVDDCDFEWLSQWKWCAVNTARKGAPPRFYAVRVENERMILMHRQIMAPGDGLVVDHDDNDGLNNQRHNMAVCTQQVNCLNRHDGAPIRCAPPRVQTSKQKGVTWNKRQGRWVVQIKRKHVGVFTDEALAIEAAKAALEV